LPASEEVEDLTRRLAQCESHGPTPAAGEPAGLLPGLLAQDDKVVELLEWSKARDYVVRPGVRPGFEGSVDALRTLLLAGAGKPEAAVVIRVWNQASERWEVEEATLLSSSGEALAQVRTLTPVVIEDTGRGRQSQS
jgi:hypothetical protein